MTPEVVVIGGGPAGLAAALALGRHGVRTLVCERQRYPVDKACGEGLLPQAVASLEHFGVAASELADRGVPIAGVRYFSERGRSAGARFAPSSAFGVARPQLSAALAARVRAFGCVRLLEGVSATARFGAGPSAPEVWIGTERLLPRLVLGADGLASRVRRAACLGSAALPPRRWGIRQHFELTPWTDHVEVYFAQGVEAYVTPLPGALNLALLWEPDRVRTAPGERLLPELLRCFPELVRRLRGARAQGRPRASGPLHQRVEPSARPGLLLIGDAAGYVDALTGEGVGLALAQARVLERCLAPHLVTGDRDAAVPVAVLARTQRALAAACRPNQRFTRFLLHLTRQPRLFEAAVALLARDPELFRHFVAASAGVRAPWRLPLGAALRLPRSALGAIRDAAQAAERLSAAALSDGE